MRIVDVVSFMQEFAPLSLAEGWDNVGLLLGDDQADVERVMTCLTVTPDSAEEAVQEQVDLIVSHHPLPFRSFRQLTTDTTPGRLLLQLIEAKVAIFSPHTAFDSAAAGINQRLAEGLGLANIEPIEPVELKDGTGGSGRVGVLPNDSTLSDMAQLLQEFLSLDGLHMVGTSDQRVTKVAIGCGSAGHFIEDACRLGCDLLVTGETNFHTCLEAEASGVALLLPGHYASERFAVEGLAKVIAGEFPGSTVWPSQRESDPLRWFAS